MLIHQGRRVCLGGCRILLVFWFNFKIATFSRPTGTKKDQGANRSPREPAGPSTGLVSAFLHICAAETSDANPRKHNENGVNDKTSDIRVAQYRVQTVQNQRPQHEVLVTFTRPLLALLARSFEHLGILCQRKSRRSSHRSVVF